MNTNTHQWSQPHMNGDDHPPTKAGEWMEMHIHEQQQMRKNGNKHPWAKTMAHQMTAHDMISRQRWWQALASELLLLPPHFIPLTPPSTLQCPTYSCRNPAGIRSFQWNPAGIQSFQWNSSGIPVESIGILNKNGIKQTKVEILIYLSQFLKLCRYIHFSLSLPFLLNVYSSTLPLKFNFK